MNTVMDSSKDCRALAREDGNGVQHGSKLTVMIFCLLALPWVVAFGQASPHAQGSANVGNAKPAQVTYENGRLTVIANGSSLSKILEQIRGKMGIVIEGNVLHDPVMGQYGPGYPRVVLKKLLDPTSYQYKMVSDGTPYSVTKVVLRLRSVADATAEKSSESAGPAPAAAATGTTAATAANVKSGNDGSDGAAALTSDVAQSPGRPAVASAAAGPTKTVPLVASPDGSPYLKGTNISVRQLQQRTAEEERRRSERLTKESQEKQADDGSK
jgi:hypothetical protein